jgi:tRNA-dihydrouridine synthase A
MSSLILQQQLPTTSSSYYCARRFSVAPMVGVTNIQYRYLCRLLSLHSTLYTEMLVDDVLFHAPDSVIKRVLEPGCGDDGNNVVLQLASCDVKKFASACEIAHRQAGYKEINLNCGCPAKSAIKHQYGAILMKQPELVGAMIREAIERCNSSSLEITVKCRLGVDEFDSYHHVKDFIHHITTAGTKRVIIHARKGLLKGLGTKGNRSVPPLKYDWVQQLCTDFPDTLFELNGGIHDLISAQHCCEDNSLLAGVMLGRAIMRQPLMLAKVDQIWYNDHTNPITTRRELFTQYFEHFNYGQSFKQKEIGLLLEPIIGMFSSTSCNKRYRGILHESRSQTNPVQYLLSKLEESEDFQQMYDLPFNIGLDPSDNNSLAQVDDDCCGSSNNILPGDQN